MHVYNTLTVNENRRILLIHDDMYEPDYGLDTPEETAAAIAHENAKLDSGEWTAYALIEEERCEHCGEWHRVDSLWGCVFETPAGAEDDDFTREVYTACIGPIEG